MKHSITTPLSPVQTQLRNFLVAYSLSFATVWMLTTVNGGTYQTAIQPLTRRALRISKDELFLEAEDCFIIPAVIAKKTASTVDISRENVRAGPSHENMQRNSITITDSGKTGTKSFCSNNILLILDYKLFLSIFFSFAPPPNLQNRRRFCGRIHNGI